MRRLSNWIRHLGIVLGVLVLAGCMPASLAELGPALATSMPEADAPTMPAPTQLPQHPTGPPKEGEPAPNFAVVDLDGNTVTLESLRGKKVLLNFWATWCPPCKAEVPLLVENYPLLRAAGYEIVAVSVMEERVAVAAFAASEQMTFPVVIDSAGQVAMSYYVQGIPVSYFLDEEGIIEEIHLGILTPSSLQARIEGR